MHGTLELCYHFNCIHCLKTFVSMISRIFVLDTTRPLHPYPFYLHEYNNAILEQKTTVHVNLNMYITVTGMMMPHPKMKKRKISFM